MTVLGLIAATCTTGAFLPQVIKTVKLKETKDIALGTFLLFTIGGALWLVYGLLSGDLPVTLANAVSVILAAMILRYKLKYH